MNVNPFSVSRSLYLIILLLGVVCWIALGAPFYRSWREKAERIEIQKQILDQNLMVISRRDWIEKNYEAISEAQKSSGSDAQEVARLQNEITSLAKQTGVVVQKTKPRAMESGPFTKRLLIELDCQGKMIQMADFIYRMQDSPQALKVEQLRLSLQDEKTSVLRASLLVSKLIVLE